jgi:hypothetical protein
MLILPGGAKRTPPKYFKAEYGPIGTGLWNKLVAASGILTKLLV